MSKLLKIYLFDALCIFSFKMCRLYSSSPNKKKVLAIKLDAIGDAILWLGSAQYLRKIYPSSEYEVFLVCNKNCTDLYKVTGYFDNILGIDRILFKSNYLYRYKILKKICRYFYDIIIHPTFSREFYYGDSIVRVCKAINKIGFIGDLTNIKEREKDISDKWYTALVSSQKGQAMELVRYTDFIRYLGYNDAVPELIHWTWFSQYNVDLSKSYFVIFSGASIKYRMWPIERFAEIAVRVNKATGWNVVVVGGKQEEFLGNKITELLLNSKIGCTNLVGKTDLIDLATVIKQAKLLIGNETSAVHMAATVRTPSVCILGGGHYGRFLPYNIETDLNRIVTKEMDCFQCNWQCIYDYSDSGIWRCIDEVNVEDVWNSVTCLLNDMNCAGGTDAHRI